MAAYILPCDSVATNKANPNKSEKYSVSDANIVSMIGEPYFLTTYSIYNQNYFCFAPSNHHHLKHNNNILH